MPKKPLQIPFTGNVLCTYQGYAGKNIIWRENTTFSASIQLTGWYKARSATRISCVNLDNQERYSLTMEAFYNAVTLFKVKDSIIQGNWTFKKQGAYYTLFPDLSW